MSPWANFSLGFTYLSPVVGVYTLFAFALATGGPPMIWSFVIVGLGPVPGGAGLQRGRGAVPGRRRRLPLGAPAVGPEVRVDDRLGLHRGAARHDRLGHLRRRLLHRAVPSASSHDAPTSSSALSPWSILATIINFMGTKVLAMAAMFGFAAEIIGALVVGGWLLIAHREHGLGVLFDTFGTAGRRQLPSGLRGRRAHRHLPVLRLRGLRRRGRGGAGPGRLIPKAMRRTIYIGGAAATFVCLALILAVTDIPAVIAGEDADPVSTLLDDAFGSVGSRIVLAVVLISFLSCAMSLQAAASRLAYSYGRDEMIMGHRC